MKDPGEHEEIVDAEESKSLALVLVGWNRRNAYSYMIVDRSSISGVHIFEWDHAQAVRDLIRHGVPVRDRRFAPMGFSTQLLGGICWLLGRRGDIEVL